MLDTRTSLYGEMSTDALWSERRRLAALRDPAMMGRYLDPEHFAARAHTKLIGHKLAQLGPGRVERLLITTPPQVGKSVLVSELLPFWWLAHRPRDRVLIGSYAADLAVKKSRAVREMVREHGDRFGLTLRHGESAGNDWSLMTGGGVRAAGVGGSLTGFPGNCIAGDVYIDTPSGRTTIGQYVESRCAEPVLSYDHETGEPAWGNVTATSVNAREVVEVVTRSGRTVRCTAEHRFYVPGRGYTPAGKLTPGTPLLASELPVRPVRQQLRADTGGSRQGHPQGDRNLLFPGVRQRGSEHPEAVPHMQGSSTRYAEEVGVLLGRMPGRALHRDLDVPAVRRDVQHDQGGSPEAAEAEHGRPTRDVLEGVPGRAVRGRAKKGVQVVRRAVSPVGTQDLLLPGVQEDRRRQTATQDTARSLVPAVQRRIPPEVVPDGLLLAGVRERGSRVADDRPGELPVQKRQLVREALPGYAPSGHGTRQPHMRGLQRTGDLHNHHPQGEAAPAHDLPRAPHQRGPEGQSAGKPRDAVRHLSRRTPPLSHDAVAVVRRVRDERVRVYDLQVEGTSNFFAGSVLVHNCAIIDDPHKDRREAESTAIREGVWDWWSGTMLSRLSPGAPVVMILTRWHEKDLAGKLLEHEGTADQGGRWHVVHLPAYATTPEDPLGRPVGAPLTHPLIPDSDTEALIDHWEAKRQGSTVRDWGALYMGDPKPREGALLTAAQIERQRHFGAGVERVRRAVAVDPSGGGRDTAGIVAGFLGLDQRVYITHDRTRVMPSTEWARQACLLAYETDAQVIYVEKNYGGDLSLLPVAGAWDQLQREGHIPEGVFKPYIEPKNAKSGKVVRAEPIAQAWLEDRVRTHAFMPELEDEWATYQPGVPDSPGRLDASVYLVYGLLQLPGSDRHIGSAAGVSLSSAGAPGTGGGLGSIGLGRGR